MNTDSCPACGKKAIEFRPYSRHHSYDVYCETCGRYIISSAAINSVEDYCHQDPLFQKRLRRFLHDNRGAESIELYWGRSPEDGKEMAGIAASLESISQMYRDEGSPLDKYEGALVNIARLTTRFGHRLTSDQDRWVIPTMDDEEAWDIVQSLHTEGYVDAGLSSGLIWDATLTPSGLRRASELQADAKHRGNVVFIAACFNDDLASARDTIHDAVAELGYTPKLVNLLPHNDLIDLQIYEGIRESRFIVADLTCNRQSVYYEVGFAHGLGLEVVLTCRTDHLEDSAADDFKHVHFDLNHRNILVWETDQELAEKLRLHIHQSFGRAG